MTGERINLHGTAIVIGTTGILFVGPSGSGKSILALSCLAAAQRSGHFSALISDDQVFISRHGDHLLAQRAETIAGMIEIRGSGITKVESHPATLLHYAVLPVDIGNGERLPPDDECFEVFDDAFLPLIRMPANTPDPLAVLSAHMPL